MALRVGTRLGPYEIVAPIGAGGMGEVYRAKDSRLDRTVAIKVLPEHLAESAERKQRFEREAKAISQLNHAHICTLHDVGSQDGVDFLVMEYIEGETLADRLERQPALSLDDALDYGMQIAEALDAAHRRGVVHRDLKPANVAITESGVKLLDFGLAKLAQAAPDGDISSLQTQPKPLTSEGAILGTFQYMAPEQIEGKEVDARTDIFALGVVLYEMLTGKRAFEGKTQASLMAAILEREPEAVSVSQPLTPRSLDRVVSRCLAKDPARRWQGARDVREVLSWVADEGYATAATENDARRVPPAWLPWAVAVIAAVAATAAWLGAGAPESVGENHVAHLMLTPPRGAALVPTVNVADLAISPNAEHIVYPGGDPRRLFVRGLDAPEVTTLVPGGGNPRNPFFSPNGEWVGFIQENTLKKISVHGGPTTALADVGSNLRGGSWGPNDDIVFGTSDVETGLLRISSAGGEPEVLTVPDASAGELEHAWPDHLPGGKAVLFDIQSSGDGPDVESQIAYLDLETGARKILLPAGAHARYVTSGHILYVVEKALWAVRFDLDRLKVVGNPFPVLERVNQKVTLAANYAVSRDGALVYNPNASEPDQRVLKWVDRRGRSETLPLDVGAYNSPALSPDGTKLVLSITDETGANIWVYDIERGTLGKRTFGGNNRFPIWTPDGEEIFYTAGAGSRRLMRMRADGTSRSERLGIDIPEIGFFTVPTSWSTVHRTLLFQYLGNTFQLSLDEEGIEPFVTHEGATVREARFSPDEQFVAFRSNESGRDEVYVVPFLGPGKWQISTDGGAQPMWSPAGGELFYTSGNRMMAVPVETEPTFDHGTPRVLFETPLPERVPGDPSRYGVSADGQRFLVVAPAPNADPYEDEPEIHVIVNFFDYLERLSPSEE